MANKPAELIVNPTVVDMAYKLILLIIAIGGILVAVTLFPFGKFATKENAEDAVDRMNRQKAYTDQQDALIRANMDRMEASQRLFEQRVDANFQILQGDVKTILRVMPRTKQ